VEIADLLRAAVAVEGAPRAVVAHSGGCMAAALCLLKGMPMERLVFIAPMTQVSGYTGEFARRFGFGERTRIRLVPRLERRVAAPLSAFDLSTVPSRVTPPPLLLIHDRDDAEISYADSESVAVTWPQAELVTTTGLGHRRIMRAPQVVAQVVDFVGSALAPTDRRGGATAL
jgi:predicted alpha/beta hydrolase family esterase